jgi:phosphate transport system substrate-binding protein
MRAQHGLRIIVITALAAGLLVLGLAGCVGTAPVEERELRLRGSDTMLMLNRRLAEAFMRANPGVSVRVEGGGTEAGVEALAAGEAEIAAASRPLTADEVAAIYDRFRSLGVRHLIAQDALCVFVNVANPVRDMSSEQLRGLFDGSIRSWSALGGGDLEVVVIVRSPSSGTFRFFRDHVLMGQPYAAGARALPTTPEILEAVRRDPRAVGYGGVAYRLPGTETCAIDGVPPTLESVRDGRYSLARYLAFYTVEVPAGLARRFVAFCQSAEGQAIVAEVGYIPLWER